MIVPPPNPLQRARITQPLSTGVKALDAMLTIGIGQRVGIFAAAGGGKSTLLSMIARNVEADSVVLALIGERGREVLGFLQDDLGEEGLKKSTVVVSTAEQPSLLRLKAAYTATAIAEEARRRGERVVLMMDSVTRFARALREVGLAAGEPPGRQGYPASVFATLPVLFERAGNDNNGSITALYTVLVAGDDLEEPVADETISLLDGHIILSRKLAARGHYPAIDVLRSKSRLMHEITTKEHRKAAQEASQVMALYEENYDKISVGVYESGSDERVDNAIARIRDVEAFLRQERHEVLTYEQSVEELKGMFPA
jgi:FliI/YscN family ATPase